MIDFQFPHEPPKGYSYEIEQFKRNLLAIWICNHGKFSYTDKTPKSIWGFYNTKTKTYHSPINATKSGDPIEFKYTTPYSAMKLKLNPLEYVLFAAG